MPNASFIRSMSGLGKRTSALMLGGSAPSISSQKCRFSIDQHLKCFNGVDWLGRRNLKQVSSSVEDPLVKRDAVGVIEREV